MTKKIRRFEFKYRISAHDARRIARELERYGMRLDEHATRPDGGYHVTSLYFDSFNLSDYLEKVSGAYRRRKIRLRIYEPYLNDSEKVFLEIKHKSNMTNRKTKMTIDREAADDFIKNGPRALCGRKWEGKDRQRSAVILHHILRSSARPRTVITYIRTAYMSRDKDIRITFDRDIKAGRQNDMSENIFLRPVLKDGVIMELKYQYILPFWFKRIIQDYNLTRDTYSKYEKGLEAIYAYNPLLR